jgi:exodeoxyribonuclease VII small subunit
MTDALDALDALTFEQLVDELERTIEQMASGALGIEEVTDLYERAGKLHAAASDRLARIQARIETLTGGVDAPGTVG